MIVHPTRGDIEAFRAVLARKVGLRFDEDKLVLLGELLTTRAQEKKLGTAGAYVDYVATSAGELAVLARTLTVSETYFLRDRDQFRALESLLAERRATPTRHLRLLSAGCSSGEEAYSLAIMVRETLGELGNWNVSILGVDLNPEVIERAVAASYTSWSLRETSNTVRQRYFSERAGRYFLGDAVRNMVRFERQNLVLPNTSFWRSEAFEIVFCRNVLMYLTPDAARLVVHNIARALVPGGHLFLGHAENLRGISNDFHLKHSHGTFYYERRAALQPAANVAPIEQRMEAEGTQPPVTPTERLDAEARRTVLFDDTSWFQAIARASNRIERLSRDAANGVTKASPAVTSPASEVSPARASPSSDFAPAFELMKQERFQEALRLLALAEQPGAADPDTLLLRAMLLVSTGDLRKAEALCEELMEVDELNAGAHYVMAMCREHVGDRPGSVEHSHAAAYLDPGFAMPHLQLGRLARRSGDTATARRELGLALGLLSREDVARIVLFGGGFSREALIEICRGELQACGGDR